MPYSDAKASVNPLAAQSALSDELPRLLNITLDQVAEGLDGGKFTSVDLVKAYLARIKECNDEFRSVLQINPDAVHVAELLDQEREQSGKRGCFHGVPILIKDNIVTEDKLEVTAGSYALVGAKPSKEATVISRLRRAGAIILGKTNLSEWANFRSAVSSNGWSARGGQTLGTYYPGSDPSGSSSGSGVAASLGLCVVTLGSETSGSIISPSENSCIVGHKPTRGLVPNDGAIPISHRQDVIGPMTRTVRDAAHVLNAIAGRSESDDLTWNIPFDPVPDFTAACQSTDLPGVRIGVPRNTFLKVPPFVLAAFETALKILSEAGAEIVEEANFESAEEWMKLDKQTRRTFCITAEFKSDLAKYLSGLQENPNNIHTLEDLISFTKSFPQEEYPERDIDVFLGAQADDSGISGAKYRQVREKELYFGGAGGILGALEKFNLDVLAIPSTIEIPTVLAAQMGYPILTVPLGFYPEETEIEKNKKGDLVKLAPGMPFCISFITKEYGDAKLLQVGYAFEQRTKVRLTGLQPYKAPTTELKDV